jgi:methyl-accepting chemotaxis protein
MARIFSTLELAQTDEYKRIGKGGNEVWILASYNPVLDEKGKPLGVAAG